MGLLFAFFLIGLPLLAGVGDYLMTTGQLKNDDMADKIGGYTPRWSARATPAPVMPEPVPAPAPILMASTQPEDPATL